MEETTMSYPPITKRSCSHHPILEKEELTFHWSIRWFLDILSSKPAWRFNVQYRIQQVVCSIFLLVNHLLHFPSGQALAPFQEYNIGVEWVMVSFQGHNIGGKWGWWWWWCRDGEGESRTRQHTFQFRVRTCNSTKLETCFRFRIQGFTVLPGGFHTNYLGFSFRMCTSSLLCTLCLRFNSVVITSP